MTNIIPFAKHQTATIQAKSKSFINEKDREMKCCAILITKVLNDAQAKVQDVAEWSELTYMLKVMTNAYISPHFDIDKRYSKALLLPAVNVHAGENETTGMASVEFIVVIKGQEANQEVTACGLYTNKVFNKIAGRSVESLRGAPRLDWTDAMAVKTIFYDYLYEHPLVDTQADWAPLSIIGYEVIEALIADGYVLRHSTYQVQRGAENEKEVGPLYLEFFNGNAPIARNTLFFVFDNAMIFKASAHFLSTLLK